MQTYELCSDMIDVVVDISCIYGTRTASGAESLPYDRDSESVMRLDNGCVLVLREVDRYLALVCLVREANYATKSGLISFNFAAFRSALKDIFSLSIKHNAK
jgi:Ras-related GTP-binding protein C/D